VSAVVIAASMPFVPHHLGSRIGKTRLRRSQNNARRQAGTARRVFLALRERLRFFAEEGVGATLPVD
jgi:hypothetical protein